MSFISSMFPLSSGKPSQGGHPAAPAPAPVPAPAPTPAPAPAPTPSPLDDLAKIWDTPLTADGKPVPPPVNPLSQPLFNFDPTKINDAASKMDFTGSIPAETITKAPGGDAAAFADALNTAVRSAVAGMTLSQGNLINQALLANNARIENALPNQINRARLLETSPEDNPIFSHPAVAPLAQTLKQMAFSKDPNASPAEITKQVNGFLTGLAEAISSTSPARKAELATRDAASGTDWNNWDPA
mgnify:FL=1